MDVKPDISGSEPSYVEMLSSAPSVREYSFLCLLLISPYSMFYLISHFSQSGGVLEKGRELLHLFPVWSLI